MNQATQDFIRQHQDDDVVSSCLVGQVSKASSILLIFLWSNAPLNLLRFTRQNWQRDCSACRYLHLEPR